MTEAKQNPVTEELFRETYGYKDIKQLPLLQVIARELKCSTKTLLNLFPIAKWMPKYKCKDLLSDIIAGMTVAVMHIPHGLAYAPLGRVEPVVGFYMAIFPVFLYIFMGTSRHISLGTFAVVCAMVGEAVQIQQSFDIIGANSTNATIGPQITSYSALEIGTVVCFFVGVFQTLLGLFKLGVITIVMSESLISGFTTGAACHVFSYQLKNLFGIQVRAPPGILKLIFLYIDFFRNINTVNLVTMSISCVAILILIVFNEFLKPAIKKKCPENKIPIPIEFFVIVVGILVSYFFDLSQNFNVKTVEHIPTGLPHPLVPPFELSFRLINDSFVIAIVAIAVNLSLAKIFAKKAGYTVTDNQELVAYGFANIFASFFSCLPSAASLSRSSIQFSVGGKTQLASFFSVLQIILILMVAGALFEPVPFCVLSAIVVVTLKGLLYQIFDFPKFWKRNRWNGIIWMSTFLTVILLDLSVGLGIGVTLSMVSLMRNSYSIEVNVLGRVSNTKILLSVDNYSTAVTHPNVLTLQIVGNINFSNSSLLETKLTTNLKKFLASSVDQEQIYVILNMKSATNIDPAGVIALKNFYDEVINSKCDLYIADCNVKIFKAFEICDFFKDFPKDQVLATTDDAIDYLNSLI